jgi:hypothetical protein
MEEKDFYLPSSSLTRFVFKDSMADQSRGKDARIVEDDYVALAETGRKFGKRAVAPGSVDPVDNQHTRTVAFRQRLLRDQFGRQFKIEFPNIHNALLKQIFLLVNRTDSPIEAEMLVSCLRHDAPAWSAVQKTDLNQVWLVDLFDGFFLFVDCR